jgi:Uma2 family endonuclease
VAVQTHVTVEEFDRIAQLPENDDKRLEFIGGEVIEVPSNAYGSKIAAIISGELYIFLKGKDLGHLTGEAGGYMVYGERYAPDVAFISKARQPELAKAGYNPKPPEFAVEVVSPNDDESKLLIKVGNYLAVGTLVWVVRPTPQHIEIYAPSQQVRIVGINGTVDCGDVLPGFKLEVKDIFAG